MSWHRFFRSQRCRWWPGKTLMRMAFIIQNYSPPSPVQNHSTQDMGTWHEFRGVEVLRLCSRQSYLNTILVVFNSSIGNSISPACEFRLLPYPIIDIMTLLHGSWPEIV